MECKKYGIPLVEFLRYLIAGTATYAVDFSVFLALAEVMLVPPVLANLVGKIAGGIFSFFSHRIFTFRIQGPNQQGAQALGYFLILLLNVPLFTLTFFFIQQFIYYPLASKIISDGICIIITYIEMKFMVFRKKNKFRES